MVPFLQFHTTCENWRKTRKSRDYLVFVRRREWKMLLREFLLSARSFGLYQKQKAFPAVFENWRKTHHIYLLRGRIERVKKRINGRDSSIPQQTFRAFFSSQRTADQNRHLPFVSARSKLYHPHKNFLRNLSVISTILGISLFFLSLSCGL